MSPSTQPIVIRAELPTPDLVVVKVGGRTLVFADTRLDQATVDQALSELPSITRGPGHALR